MNRRTFLGGATSLALAQLLTGCTSQNQLTLKVLLLQNSIPAQLLSKFRSSLDRSAALNFSPAVQLQDFFRLLQEWKRPPEPKEDGGFRLPFVGNGDRKSHLPDLVTLGNYWLSQAIAQNLILPLDPQGLPSWKTLPTQWQSLVKRDSTGKPDPEGQVWGAPYAVGTTVLAYRADKFQEFGWVPTDWSDLWRPELRDRISLLDSPREVIGLTLKKLGKSYNPEQLENLPELKKELLELHQQVKLYSSDTYLQPLILGDTWLAMGWSADVLPLMQRNPQIRAIVPRSGTALWANLWVRPAGNLTPSAQDSISLSPLAQKWIEFCWHSEVAIQLSTLSKAVSPIVVGMERENLPQSLQANSVLLPSEDAIAKSEFLYPLSPEIADRYLELWREMRVS